MELLHKGVALDPEVERLVEDVDPRLPDRLRGRQLAAHGALGLVSLALTAALWIAADGQVSDPALAIALTIAYAVAYRVQFPVGTGKAIPTELVLWPMLLLLDPATVPAFVIAGFALGRLPDVLAGRLHPSRMLLAPVDGMHALGPALVLTIAGTSHLEWSDWPLYLTALAAQLIVDVVVTVLGEWLAFGVAPEHELRLMGWVALVDVLLTPIGLLAAAAGAADPAAALLVLPLVGLLELFARERRARIAQAIEMSRTYHRTALLLGDVVEADDAYTGSHSRGVVALSLAVARELGLSERDRRLCELGALLHDVGKIHIPDAILHKPAPLDEDEWVVMRRHTISGQRMLDRVGGLLREVGVVVRASHEHWDGSGYPDGLAGEAIPIAARVVTACDAYSAITTDRVYRPARSAELAVLELRACAGAQFDPQVVDALIKIVDLWGAMVTRPRAVDVQPEAVEPAAGAA